MQMVKTMTVTILLFLQVYAVFSQQRVPFSDKKMEIDGRIFLPYTQGEVVRKISGSHQQNFEKICSIITAWDSISPPQGMKVVCYGFDNSLEIYFLPYLFEEGTRFASEGGPKLNLFINDPLSMFGSPIVSDIFLCPQKVADFYEFPIYQTDHHEVTIVHKKEVPLFVSVTQEEYLKELISKEEKNTQNNSSSDYQTIFREMEQTYQKLLKTDKEAAKEFKLQMNDFTTEINQNGEGTNMHDMVSMLKKELSDLTVEARKQQACYAGSWAMEAYHNVSGLVPYENRENADALVRPNPALIECSSKNKMQLLVICWSVGESVNLDKPRFYNEGRDGFHLADNLMRELYLSQKIWTEIFQICN